MISERAFAKSFPWFWHELVPLLTPRFIGLFNEAYEQRLFDNRGKTLTSVPMALGIRAAIVAEFAFRGAQILHDAMLDPSTFLENPAIWQEAAVRAFEVIQRYEGTKPVSLDPLSQTEMSQGSALVLQYAALYSAFSSFDPIQFCPRFSGAGFLDAAEGDLGIGGTLIEVKTTTRKVSGKDLRQLITYLALDANANRLRWSRIGVFNPRRATLHVADVDALLLRLSGGKPRVDVLGELIAYVESSDLVADQGF